MNIDETTILSYLRGEFSDDERRMFEHRMSLSSGLKQDVSAMGRLWNMSGDWHVQQGVDTRAAWDQLSHQIAYSLFKYRLWNVIRTAAVILLPLFLLFHYALMPLLNSRQPEKTVTLTSAPGMVVKTVLPDGSEVWLNSRSSLTYPCRFTKKQRTVELIGEAYFKVSSDKKNRFNVITPEGMMVSAYGTEFNVNAYAMDTCHEVLLARGHVEISSVGISTSMMLEKGQKGLFRTSDRRMSKQLADTYAETAWKDGKMVFRRQRLDYIVQRLSRKYGVTIVLDGEKLKNYIYTATFTDESLEEILDLLKRSAPIDYIVSRPQQFGNQTYTKQKITIKSLN